MIETQEKTREQKRASLKAYVEMKLRGTERALFHLSTIVGNKGELEYFGLHQKEVEKVKPLLLRAHASLTALERILGGAEERV